MQRARSVAGGHVPYGDVMTRVVEYLDSDDGVSLLRCCTRFSFNFEIVLSFLCAVEGGASMDGVGPSLKLDRRLVVEAARRTTPMTFWRLWGSLHWLYQMDLETGVHLCVGAGADAFFSLPTRLTSSPRFLSQLICSLSPDSPMVYFAGSEWIDDAFLSDGCHRDLALRCASFGVSPFGTGADNRWTADRDVVTEFLLKNVAGDFLPVGFLENLKARWGFEFFLDVLRARCQRCGSAVHTLLRHLVSIDELSSAWEALNGVDGEGTDEGRGVDVWMMALFPRSQWARMLYVMGRW